MYLLYVLITLFISWQPTPNPAIVANSNMNVGSSVEGMPCPDPTLKWPCSITGGASGNAPPPSGCPVMLDKDSDGSILIYIPKATLPESCKQDWIQNDVFHAQQEIEIERELSLEVFDVDAATYIEAGDYPIIESNDMYLIKI